MNINDLEKKMRAAFGREKSAVNTDELWANIQSELPAEKKPKGFFSTYKWLPLLLLLVMVGGYIVFNTGSSELLQKEEAMTNESNISKSSQKESHSESAITSIVDMNKSSINDQTEIRAEDQVKTNESKNDIEITQNLLLKAQNNNEIEAANYNPKNSSFSYSSARNDGQSVKLTEESESTDGRRQSSLSRSYSSSPASLNDALMSENILNQSRSTSSGIYANSNSHFSNSTNASNGQLFNSSSVNTISELGVNFEQIDLLNIENLEKGYGLLQSPSEAPQRPFWIKRDRKYFIELGGTLLTGHGNLTLENPDFATHFNNRNGAEQSLLSYGFDTKIGYSISDNLKIHTGLIYNRYFKSSAATITTTQNITVQDGLIQEIVGMNGTQEIRGEVSAIRQASSTVKRINNYSYIHIPVGVSWTQPIGALDVRFGIEGRLGMSASYNGYIHPTTTAEYDLNTDTDQIFNSNAPHFMSGNIGIIYPMNDIIGIGLDINYQYQINNINTDTYGITENLSGIGLRTGIQIKI